MPAFGAAVITTNSFTNPNGGWTVPSGMQFYSKSWGTASLPELNGLTGLKLFGSIFGKLDPCVESVTYCGGAEFLYSGDFAGPVMPAEIPFTFLFTASGVFTYTVSFTVNDHTWQHDYGPASGVQSGGGVLTLPAEEAETWAASLAFHWNDAAEAGFNVQIPASSFDLNTVVPEPATLLLLIPALGALLWKRRRANA